MSYARPAYYGWWWSNFMQSCMLANIIQLTLERRQEEARTSLFAFAPLLIMWAIPKNNQAWGGKSNCSNLACDCEVLSRLWGQSIKTIQPLHSFFSLLIINLLNGKSRKIYHLKSTSRSLNHCLMETLQGKQTWSTVQLLVNLVWSCYRDAIPKSQLEWKSNLSVETELKSRSRSAPSHQARSIGTRALYCYWWSRLWR